MLRLWRGCQPDPVFPHYIWWRMSGPFQTFAADQPYCDESSVAPAMSAAIDYKAFAADVEALHATLKADLGEADLAHLRKMIRLGRVLTLLGYAVAWPFPNPLAAVLIGLGNMGRWACVTHPVMHRGYDAVPNVPAHLTSRK